MGKDTLTSPPGYLVPTRLSALLMLRAWAPTRKRAVPLLTSTETFTIFCRSITVAPSVLFLGAREGFAVCPARLPFLIDTVDGGAEGGIVQMTQSQQKEANESDDVVQMN
jgi:hypothetical protein